MAKPKLNKRCKTCGSLLQDKNKSGFCNHHRNRTGANNPFYGRTHDRGMIEKTKNKLREISTELWKNKDYRESIIEGVSKPRREGFKEEQSARVTQWFKDNPEQGILRKKIMSENWKKGIITKNNHSCNQSKIEIEFLKKITEIYPDVEKKTLRYLDSWLFPDAIILNDRIIIEFYGDFWHANPVRYQSGDIIHHRLTAQEIWDRDEQRILKFWKLGFMAYIVWQSEYKEDPDSVLNKLDSVLNWESCSI